MDTKYILFEWKLISRSRRLKQMQLPLVFFILQYYLMLLNDGVLYRSLFMLCFLTGLLSIVGATYSQFIFSTEGGFMDKLISSPIHIYSILSAKYKLYCILALVSFIFFLPTLFLGIQITELISSFLFAIGPVYFGCFQSARYNSQSLDIKATKYYNWQGTSFMGQWFIPLCALSVSIGMIVLFYLLLGENAALLFMSITGIVFIATHKFWLMSIARNFEKTRYRRLECFREK